MIDARRLREDTPWSKSLDAMFDPYDLEHAPGGAVGVVLKDEPIYHRAFGLANVEHRVPMTLHTRFRIASITKQFTCLTALLLAEEGLLDIDASIRNYLPELGTQSGEPTLRQLMQHSSGYRCYIDLGFIADGPVSHPASNALELQLEQTRGNFPPGERVMYCNGAYSLLSLAIERVTGQPLRRVLGSRILGPLMMKDTDLAASDFEVHVGLANLYIRRDEQWRRWIFFSQGMSGDGGMISSVDDMLIWARHLRHPDVVGSDHVWRQMLTPAVLPNGYVYDYSLGLHVGHYRGCRLIQHSGGVVGGTSYLVAVPERELDIFVVTNGSAAMVVELGLQIVDTILGDRLGPKSVSPSTERYKGLLGQYRCDRTGLLLGLVESNGSIALSLVGGPPIPLYEWEQELVAPFLVAGAGDWRIQCDGPARGADDDHLVALDCGHPDVYRRVHADPTAAVPLPTLQGDFYAPEIRAHARFLSIDGQTEMRIQGPFGSSEWAIRPMTGNLFVIVNKLFPVWTAAINLQRSDDAVVAFELSSRRTRQLAFHRVAEASRPR